MPRERRRAHSRTRYARRQGRSGRGVLLTLALALLFAAGVALYVTPASPLWRLVYRIDHVALVQDAAERHGLDPALVCAVIKCESNWDEDAVSHAGAVGLMQVMPSTAESLSDRDIVDGSLYEPSSLDDPVVNLEYGCANLEYLQEHLSSLSEVIAAYNAGLGSVQGWIADGGSIPESIEYEETRTYLQRVLKAYEGYRANYPEGITGA